MNHEELTAWAQSMTGPLGERAKETARLRQLPQATIDDAHGADYFKMVVPAGRGGWGLGLRSLTDSTRILAQGCMSSAWTLSFLALHNWFIARCDRPLQEEVFGQQGFALVPCPLAPTGTADVVDGGYQLSGRWSWATGVQLANWVMVNAMVELDGGLQSMFCLVPIDEVEVVDIWHTSGMRGTASNDVVADDLFVPAHRTILAADLRGDTPPGAELCPEPFVSYAFSPVLVMVAASPALGGAEAAVDFFREYARSRVLPYSPGDRQVEQPAAQIRLAEALATVRAARLVWQDAIDKVCDTYDAGGRFEPQDRGQMRLAAAHVVRLSLQAVDIVLEGAGASVHFEDSPLQRIHRDLLTLKGHVVYDWDRAAQLAGKLELGLEPLPTDLL